MKKKFCGDLYKSISRKCNRQAEVNLGIMARISPEIYLNFQCDSRTSKNLILYLKVSFC